MLVSEVLEKWNRTDPITDEELDFIIGKMECAEEALKGFGREFYLLIREIRYLHGYFLSVKAGRKI
jgi:hypothetical protein